MWAAGQVVLYAAVVAFMLQLVIFLSRWMYKWRNPKCNGLLPPGSSGIPLIGETLELFIPNYSFDLHPFIKKRLQRYGPLFRTNFSGHNVVISTDKEFNNFIFKQEEKLVIRWYLDLFEELFQGFDGLSNIHKYLRNLVLHHYGVECIKKNLLSQFQEIVHRTLKSWSIQDSVEIKSASVDMYGELGVKQLYSLDGERGKELLSKFIDTSHDAFSFPLNIPGTKYHTCLKNKEKTISAIKEILKTRLASPAEITSTVVQNDDLLSKMIKDMTSVNFLTEEFITQVLYGLMSTTFAAISSLLTFSIKFISENPDVLQELIAENDEFLKKRNNKDAPITWEEYKSMTFTLQVVHETFRLANSIPGFLRKAIKDIKVKGYTIPAGWGIMICHSATHLDPNIYEDPLKFNPWRWKDVKSEFIHKNLTPFGEGIKQCAGAEFTKASMCIFLHVLVTKYRWTVVKGGDMIQNPMMHVKDGLHISLSERKN